MLTKKKRKRTDIHYCNLVILFDVTIVIASLKKTIGCLQKALLMLNSASRSN